jgi:ergothioneine biosynthesis protein EgtB
MHATSVTSPLTAMPAERARRGTASEIAAALRESRRDTLATFAAYEHALPGLRVPRLEALNPPLWELGHIGWFQEFWLARNPERALGSRANPEVPRTPGPRANAEDLYHSSLVAHDSRWSLPLPDAATTRAELAAQLERTLAMLDGIGTAEPGIDDTLYFFRLALLHEDMHHEAALYMAQGLGVPIDDSRWQAGPLPDPPPALAVAAGQWQLGSGGACGFAFDNELAGHNVAVPDISIDAQAVRWAEYLPFVADGGYGDDRWWSEAGLQWRHQAGTALPRYLGRDGGGLWRQWRHGAWRPLDLREAASHLTFFEAEAWCRWAGRRLPTEAEWERCACTAGPSFRWGDVWEWTASPFAPYPGFRPHPYRDYSQPWFDGRPVLRGASFMTQTRMRHPRYRNYFQPYRNDVPAGFRSCAA